MGAVVQRWCIAALVVFSALAVLKIKAQEVDIAELKLRIAAEKADRESQARIHETELGEREKDHAAAQQTSEDKHAIEKRKLADDLATAKRDGNRMREQLRKATRADARDPTDPATCQRAIDSIDQLGGLAAEGHELLEEADGLLRERDLDVQRLQQQVAEDRRACSPKSTP